MYVTKSHFNYVVKELELLCVDDERKILFLYQSEATKVKDLLVSYISYAGYKLEEVHCIFGDHFIKLFS